MKRFVAFIMAIFMSLLFTVKASALNFQNDISNDNRMMITVLADDDDDEDDDDGWFGIKGILNSIKSVLEGIKNILFPSSDENQAKPVLEPLMQMFYGLMESGWNSVKDAIDDDNILNHPTLFGWNGVVFDIAFGLMGYAMAFWGIFAMLEQAKVLKREDGLDFKGYMNAFKGLAPGILWIGLSYHMCVAIVRLNSALVDTIFASLSSPLGSLFTSAGVDTWLDKGSGIPIVGALIDLIMGLNAMLPMLLASVVMFLASFIILIKLSIRQIEVCSLICVSPVFFAMSSYDVSKKYFERFLMTFISAVAQTTFMAIVFVIGITWQGGAMIDMAQSKASFGEWLAQFIVPLALCVMLIKPPRVLQNLVTA